MRTANGRVRATGGRTIGDMLPARGVRGPRAAAARGHGGPLTGQRIVVVRGPRAGVEGVLRDVYMRGPGYFAALEDGCETVLRPWEFEAVA